MKWAHRSMVGVAVTLASCGSGDREAYRIDETEVGPTLVRVAPVSDAPRLVFEPLWQASPASWGDPSDVSMNADHVVVVDPQTVRVHLLDAASGAQIGTFGQRGEGPGEWRRVSDAALLGDRVAVSTSSVVGLALHARSGEARGVIRFDMSSPRLTGGPDGAVLATSPVRPVVALIDPDSTSVLEIEPAASTWDEAAYGPCTRFAPTVSGVARLRCSAGRLEFHDRTGTLLSRTEWPQAPVEASEEDLDAYIERFWAARSGGRPRSSIIDRQLAGIAERARITPIFSHFRSNRADGSFLLVEQPFDGFGGEPATLHRLDPEGRHIGVVETDLFIRDAAIHGDRVALLVTDPGTGLVTLVVARLRSAVSPTSN